jgi:hypothetical protein
MQLFVGCLQSRCAILLGRWTVFLFDLSVREGGVA